MADGTIIVKLEKLVKKLEKKFDFEDLFCELMTIYGTAKSYVKGAVDNNRSYNLAEDFIDDSMVRRDIALKKRVYFRFLKNDDDVADSINQIKELSVVKNIKNDIPFIIAAGPTTICLYNRSEDDQITIDYEDLPQFYTFLLPLTGDHSKVIIKSEHDADVRACVKLTRLLETLAAHNHLQKENLHRLNEFIRRVLFCLFAEDTGIFSKQEDVFSTTFASLTAKDGSDCQQFFYDLFTVLDTPEDNRQNLKHIPHEILQFPYVNGGLFREKSFVPQFDAKTRNQLIDCGRLRWKEISPAVFGAMFQNAMDPDKRRNMGAHYTSEENILKLIKPLFLDELTAEFDDIDKNYVQESVRKKKFLALQNKISSLTFLDPACGCGNFLIVSYRELRRLENKILEQVFTDGFLNISDAIKVNINQFYGIEIEDWPAEIAHLSMWLMEHVMNQETALKFGQTIPSIPLKSSATIKPWNALTTDWNKVIKAEDCDYILGNPPFGGVTYLSEEQRTWLKSVFPPKFKLSMGDYVSGWFVKATDYMSHNKSIKTAFVSTNSLCQGIQVPTLWALLLDKGIHINFAYTSFPWTNAATNAATVTCIIVGFSYTQVHESYLFEINKGNDLIIKKVKNISPYLIDDLSMTIVKRASKKINALLDMKIGNVPRDDGNLLLTVDEAQDFIKKSHPICKFLKKFVGSDELIKGTYRYCLWLDKEKRSLWENIPEIRTRIQKVKNFRSSSSRQGTRELSLTPWSMDGTLNPKSAIVVPSVSSARREYVPIDIVNKDTIVSNLAFLIPDGDYITFSVIVSRMHMVWMRLTSGRLGTGYRYSRDLTYNTFIWPDFTDDQKAQLKQSAKDILIFRFSTKKSLAELYNPETMPAELLQLHQRNDALVESCYRDKPFASDEERLSFLLGLYNQKVQELEANKKLSKRKK